MRILLRLLSYVLRHKAQLGLAFGFSLAGVALELARPWPIKIIVDYVLAGHPFPPWLSAAVSVFPGAQSPAGLLAWCVGLATLVVVGSSALTLIGLHVGLRVCQSLVYDLLVELFAKLQRLSLKFHNRHQLGDLLQRVSGDVLVVFFAVTQVALPVVVSVLTLVGMFFIMLQLDTGLSLVALAVVPLPMHIREGVKTSCATTSPAEFTATTIRQGPCGVSMNQDRHCSSVSAPQPASSHKRNMLGRSCS